MAKYPHPVYMLRRRAKPSCKRIDCDITNNPEHHVLIDLSEEARATIAELASNLEEAHHGAMHYEARADVPPEEADDVTMAAALRKHRREEPACSYCRSIEETRALLRAAKER